MTNALVPLAGGVEEMEAVIIIDILRRAEWNVMSASIGDRQITALRGVRIIADAEWDEIDPSTFDIIVLPGGAEGAYTMCEDIRVLETIRSFVDSKKPVAAICAAPLVLQAAGVIIAQASR